MDIILGGAVHVGSVERKSPVVEILTLEWNEWQVISAVSSLVRVGLVPGSSFVFESLKEGFRKLSWLLGRWLWWNWSSIQALSVTFGGWLVTDQGDSIELSLSVKIRKTSSPNISCSWLE